MPVYVQEPVVDGHEVGQYWDVETWFQTWGRNEYLNRSRFNRTTEGPIMSITSTKVIHSGELGYFAYSRGIYL